MKLISDGDISGALMVTNDKYNVDIFLGIGGGPEGVLAASAIDAYGCKFQGRFLFNNDKLLSYFNPRSLALLYFTLLYFTTLRFISFRFLFCLLST